MKNWQQLVAITHKDRHPYCRAKAWASWHVQNGTPLHVLQELGGWSYYSMVQRYAHLSVEHLAEYADNISRICAEFSTFSGTHKKEVKERAAE